MIRTFVLVLVLVPVVAAQDRYDPLPPLPLGDVLLSLPTSHMPDRGTWEVRFAHRFNQSIDEGEAIHSLFGLDSGANVTMGLSYVPRRDVQLSLQRSNILDTAVPLFERTMIETALSATHGQRQEAAKRLGWGRNTLTRKIKELGMESNGHDDEDEGEA